MSIRNRYRLAWAWIALFSAYFLWESFTYRGFYARLAEWQIHWFGFYVPVLTFGFLASILAIPALILRARTNKKVREAQPELARQSLGLKWTDRMYRILRAGTIGFGLAAAATTLWAFFGLPGEIGPAQTISVGDPDAAAPREGPTRLVGGAPGRLAIFDQYWHIDSRDVAFFPYTAAGSNGQYSSYFIQIHYDRKKGAAQVSAPVWRGTLVRRGLPGTMRSLYAGLGLRIPEEHFTLYTSREAMRSPYLVQAAQLAITSLVLLICALFQRRQRKRLQDEAENLA